MIIPVIMAGGAGTRLWPMSNEDKPKQFHSMSGQGTLLEETINRLKPVSPEEVVIVGAEKYEKLSIEEIAKTGLKGTILSEPMPKNTAAAVLYAAVFLNKKYDDSIMVVLPADHFIRNNSAFTEVIKKGIALAEKGSLVTIGVKPDYPETGYGYIKGKDGVPGDEIPVDKFVEKPDIETAKKYVESGNYFWNSGIFVWKTSVIIEKFRELMPDHFKAFAPLMELDHSGVSSTSDEIKGLKKKIFTSLESISIDYGILENSDNRMVIPAEFGWADLGSWKAADDILDADSSSNRTQSPDKSIFVNSENCTVFSEGMRIAVVGASNLVVVQSGNDILVIDKDSSQDVRAVVDIIRKK
ncbi:MAG TPA: mannose-1-phosphate guanylyltransferase [Spirochaetota bacterium]|nr:mannose-1-phosphate guanylyltransferase [Spirochaetota bacterium]